MRRLAFVVIVVALAMVCWREKPVLLIGSIPCGDRSVWLVGESGRGLYVARKTWGAYEAGAWLSSRPCDPLNMAVRYDNGYWNVQCLPQLRQP